MTKQEVVTIIEEALNEITSDRDQPLPDLKEGNVFLGGDIPIDSLDLARVVVHLESRTGHDPFKDGFINFRTIGELAELYTE